MAAAATVRLNNVTSSALWCAMHMDGRRTSPVAVGAAAFRGSVLFFTKQNMPPMPSASECTVHTCHFWR